MPTSLDEFEPLVVALLTRFQRQNGEASDAAPVQGIAGRLRQLIDEHSLPGVVASEAESLAQRLSEAECTRRAAFAVGDAASPLLVEAVKQLVKACFYPELRQCRSSFKAVGADGSCRRQELDRVRQRVSGTHCVDCPHWRALTPQRHRTFLANQWRAGATDLDTNVSIYLPEDFRALRQWVAVHRESRE